MCSIVVFVFAKQSLLQRYPMTAFNWNMLDCFIWCPNQMKNIHTENWLMVHCPSLGQGEYMAQIMSSSSLWGSMLNTELLVLWSRRLLSNISSRSLKPSGYVFPMQNWLSLLYLSWTQGVVFQDFFHDRHKLFCSKSRYTVIKFLVSFCFYFNNFYYGQFNMISADYWYFLLI